MENNSLNYDVLHHFFEGWKTDFDNRAESNKTFSRGVNGRLVSRDGVLSYVSVDGTLKVYENSTIKKYLGYYAFKDELFLITKVDQELPEVDYNCADYLIITVTGNELYSEDGEEITIVDYFDTGIAFTEMQICSPDPGNPNSDEEGEFDLENCSESGSNEESYGDLFSQVPMMPLQPCPIYDDVVPVNNATYKDALWTMTYNNMGILVAKLIWVGNLNLPINGKICCVGVDENAFRKPVYFTDYENPVRVVNLRDNRLSYRRPEEFSLSVSGRLLNPRVEAIENNGTLNSMSVMYLYRLITDNGQVSDFSASSKMIRINKNDGDFEFSGGDISEPTNKSVRVSAIVPDYVNFSEIQLIAVEYEAANTPTAIRMIGRKSVNFYNEFIHYGSESEFVENITLADIFANSISWKYASDLNTYGNKMIAAGLRNDPSIVNSKNMDLDFALHGFHYNEGETHACLRNPDPARYQYIDKNMSEPFFLVSKKIFRKIEVFGSFSMKFINKATGDMFEYFVFNAPQEYKSYIDDVLSWMLNLQDNDPDFASIFPNLKIESLNRKIVMSQIDPGLNTDLHNYDLKFSTSQVILDTDNKLQLKEYDWPSTNTARNSRLVYGAVSNGYYQGNGVRVTMRRKYDHVMDKNTDWHNGSGPILQIKAPTLLRGCMKGEIYRLGILWYKNGNKLFTTVLGDIKIPELNMLIRELDESGNLSSPTMAENTDKYTNFVVKGNEMYAQRIELMVDVRVSCELAQEVDSWQLVYVERTEQNRTILAQGITGPLHRMNRFRHVDDVDTDFPEPLTNKWNLPYYGGPVIDAAGFESYDEDPDNETVNGQPGSALGYDFSNGNWKKRITTHRKLFYFDAPDLIYNRISDKNIQSSSIEYLMSLSTDHDRFNIVTGHNRETTKNNDDGVKINFPDGSSSTSDTECPFGDPKFSNKIPFSAIAGDDSHKPHMINASVFSVVNKKRSVPIFTDSPISEGLYEIDKSASANEGELISGFRMGESFDLSNQAAVLAAQGWWWQIVARIRNSASYSTFRNNNTSFGRPTLFVKTKENFYTSENMNQDPFFVKAIPSFGSHIHDNFNADGYDAHIVANIRRSNQDSIYGGRTDFAYSSNEYVAMGDVIPVIREAVSSQIVYIQGDTYCHLFLRNKNSFNGSETPENTPFNYPDDRSEPNRTGAWCYAVVLESTVEPRLNYSDEFYRFPTNVNFKGGEALNEAYLQENTLERAIPRPFKFQDDPSMKSTIAVSDTKVSGDYYDAFTRFRVNEFYELDKDKGAALNIAKQEDKLFVIQELQTSNILIDERALITPDDGGKAINIAQGSGNSIQGHQVVSEYGTSIRRAIVHNPVFGFCFIDERKKEFVKMTKPLFSENLLSLELFKLFSENKIMDTEGYYDDRLKETNIRVRLQNGLGFLISYNEALKCFNGIIEHHNDIYPVFQETILAPYANSAKLAQLNVGKPLDFFEEIERREMFLQVVSAPDPSRTKIEKGIAVHVNINYPIKKTTFETSLGHVREILGTHPFYKIREGVHTLPALNEMDITDIRGEWIKITLNLESKNDSAIAIHSLVNYLRNSYK